MYILFVTRGYPTKKYKMNGIFEFDQAKALTNAGHKVIYAAVDVRSLRRWRKWGFESFEKDGVQIEAINVPCGNIPKKLLSKISKIALKMLYEKIYMKYGQPDIIHAHFIGSGYNTAQLFYKSGIPLVLTEHYSAMNQRQLSSYLYKIGKYTYPRMNKVIAVSNNLAKNIKQKFGVGTLVIPNIVDTSTFKYRLTRNNTDSFDFISTGNLLTNKRMDLLIEAFYKAFNSNKKVRLYIFGEGPERKKLEKIISDNNLEEQVFLMGLVDRQVIADKMSESNCFVLASKLETFGVAYIEAMAMGLPVIATKCGGPEDFINEGNGLLVPVDDSDALADAMKNMYSNFNKYNRQEIVDSTKRKFSSEVIANKLTDEVYKKHLDGSK